METETPATLEQLLRTVDAESTSYELFINSEGIICDGPTDSPFARQLDLFVESDEIMTNQLSFLEYLDRAQFLGPDKELIHLAFNKLLTPMEGGGHPIQFTHFTHDGWYKGPHGPAYLNIDLRRTAHNNLLFTVVDKSYSTLLGKFQQLNSFYRDAIGIIAHELPSPQTGILGFVTLLEQYVANPNEETTHALKSLKDIAHRIGTMRTRYTNFLRVESGALTPELSVVNMTTLLSEELEKTMSTHTFTNGDVPSVYVSPHLVTPSYLISDKGFLEIIFSNLFSNSLKYGGDDTFIGYGCETIGDHHRLFVSNTGSVIP